MRQNLNRSLLNTFLLIRTIDLTKVSDLRKRATDKQHQGCRVVNAAGHIFHITEVGVFHNLWLLEDVYHLHVLDIIQHKTQKLHSQNSTSCKCCRK